jgi:hypothetical protein
MPLTNEAKKDILNFVLELVTDISDKEYQKRVWIRGEGPECIDFTETCCHFLHEGDGVLEKNKDFGITDDQYQQLKEFRDSFRAFSDENDFPEEFIDSPEWAKIMDMAKDVLKAFNYQKK